MPDDCRNIYKICRKSAGLTQEAAAERLGISVESLPKGVYVFKAGGKSIKFAK